MAGNQEWPGIPAEAMHVLFSHTVPYSFVSYQKHLADCKRDFGRGWQFHAGDFIAFVSREIFVKACSLCNFSTR